MINNAEVRFCGGLFLTLVLKARKRPVKNQDECLKNLLKIYDRSATGLVGNSLSTITSRFRKCDPTLNSEYIQFGDMVKVQAFNDRLKESYSSVRNEMVGFADKYLDLETNGKWLVRAILELVGEDASIKDTAKFHIKPGHIPAYKSEMLEMQTVYFYDFLLGIWHYICSYCSDNGCGAETYNAITEATGESRERTLKNSRIGLDRFKNIVVSYDLIDRIEEMNDENQSYIPLVGEDDVAPDLGEFDPENILLYREIPKAKPTGRYSTYLRHAYAKHKEKKTFLYETQRPFYDFFVCNDIKRRIVSPIYGYGVSGSGRLNPPISDVNIEKFPDDKNFIILAGTGGLGKSMMMTHFMLDTIKKYSSTECIPIFALVRDYKPEEGDLIDFLYRELSRHDTKLLLSDLIDLLTCGKAVILLDGLDELKAEYRDTFNKEIELLADSYPDSFYVISSRPTVNFKAYSRFTVYDLQLFTQEQSIRMIEKLDKSVVDSEIQRDFIEDLRSNRFKFSYEEKTEFLGNPLFLTIMLLTYEGNHDIPSQRYLFYEQAYDAMAKKHDATKSLTREFATQLSSRDFQYYFGEFCAITYEQEKYDFTSDEIEDCFDEVIRANDLDATAEQFIEDITGKICLMYLDGGKYYFVHRSFQEYFVAYFFSKQLEQTYDAILEMLMERDETDHDSMILPMLYGIDSKKTELCVFIPFLKEIFDNKKEKNNYKYFLERLYPTICYETGETDEFSEDTSVSAIYNYVLSLYDLKEYLIGEDLVDEDMNVTWEYVYYDKNWDKPNEPEKMQLIKECELPDGYKSYYESKNDEEMEIVGRVHQIEVSQAYARSWDKETITMIESDSFPLKKEYIEVKKKYEELRTSYEKKKVKKSFISRFH